MPDKAFVAGVEETKSALERKSLYLCGRRAVSSRKKL